MGSFGFPELIVIMVIVLLLFGYKRIGQLGKGLGEGIRNFKASVKPSKEDGNGEAVQEPGESS